MDQLIADRLQDNLKRLKLTGTARQALEKLARKSKQTRFQVRRKPEKEEPRESVKDEG